MISAWAAVAFLAGSWAFGLAYYTAANMTVWLAMSAVGICFLLKSDFPVVRPVPAAISSLVLIPAAFIAQWPYRLAPLTLLAGLALLAVPVPRNRPKRLGHALVSAGEILLAQALAILAYRHLTAISRELPPFLAKLLAAAARLLTIDAAYSGRNIALYSMRKVHLLAATWELLLDPLTLCFLVGGVVYLISTSRTGRSVAVILLVVLLWLPVRSGLLMGIFLHRVLTTDYDTPFRLMGQFWDPWILTLLLCGPVCLASCFVPDDMRAEWAPMRRSRSLRNFVGMALAAACVCAITTSALLSPPGERKDGRVLIDEFHSSWEPTDRPFDTTWYGHDAGYNYACIYDYCSRYYEMSRLTNRIDAGALAECDILVLKVPTSNYAVAEIERIVRFVESGGGLVLIGEHTDVFHTSTHLNQVARMFGFEFRDDCLFGIDSPFHQLYCPPLVPHPITQHMPPMDFAVSCSIAPLSPVGRAAILSTGLWSLPADYHASNFYPQVEDRADCRYGAFVQLWASHRGSGRVVAFSDSTIFSNFSTFEPGKAELMLGMLEWANHKAPLNLRPLLFLIGALLGLAAAIALWRAPLPFVLAAGLLAWAAAVSSIRVYHRAALPPPEPVRPMTMLMVDRSLSDVRLSKSGFIKAGPEGFGIFEQWILKLGYFTSRRGADGVLAGDVAVFIQPDKQVTPEFRKRLVRYVESGGKVLVLDSALNTDSTANALLQPFGITMTSAPDLQGALAVPEGWPEGVPAGSVRSVAGGHPFAELGGRPVATRVRSGKGAVVAVGFGARFNDENMGITTDIEPDERLREVFELEFRLLRGVVEDKL